MSLLDRQRQNEHRCPLLVPLKAEHDTFDSEIGASVPSVLNGFQFNKYVNFLSTYHSSAKQLKRLNLWLTNH